MDIFVEQIIKKKMSKTDILVFIGVLLVNFLIIALLAVYIPMILLPALVGIFALDYYLISSRSLEYEYSVTNSDLTIDKIINRRNRKKVISIDAHDIESLGKYRREDHAKQSYSAKFTASRCESGKDAWCIVARHAQKGNVLVLFSPNEKILAAMKPYLSRQVAVNAFGRN
ncbi:DUF6106 family protein [Caproiciproducens faecalis]|uniref:Uncharacterized protein n=1 Tax=Caproiciproducens faecalis TaxID=2820301 RepID=A0ABS7DQY4_9FIRM|nr:DUF6106 family protein [Caproiciproducens faecalis]MBW7573705.1 hypothetical protein [Caproiciproducens faecalis]